MSDQKTYKVGDVVRLMSGGPEMTVTDTERYTGADEVRCAWFKDGVMMRDMFRPDTLELAEKSSMPKRGPSLGTIA